MFFDISPIAIRIGKYLLTPLTIKEFSLKVIVQGKIFAILQDNGTDLIFIDWNNAMMGQSSGFHDC